MRHVNYIALIILSFFVVCHVSSAQVGRPVSELREAFPKPDVISYRGDLEWLQFNSYEVFPNQNLVYTVAYDRSEEEPVVLYVELRTGKDYQFDSIPQNAFETWILRQSEDAFDFEIDAKVEGTRYGWEGTQFTWNLNYGPSLEEGHRNLSVFYDNIMPDRIELYTEEFAKLLRRNTTMQYETYIYTLSVQEKLQ